MTLYRTDASKQIIEGSATTALWLGDQNDQQSDVMVAMFGDYIQSDIVQMSHHAGVGSTFGLYNLCQPRVVLIPQSRELYLANINDTAGGGWKGWSCTKRVVTEIESVEYVIINDDYNTVMTVTATGLNMELRSTGNPDGIYSVYDSKMTQRWSTTDVIAPDSSWIKKNK
jgi:hypothetical protein